MKRTSLTTENFGKLLSLFFLRKKNLKNDEIISDDLEVADTLNKFFSNVIKNLKIPEKFANNNLSRILSKHPTLNAIMKYKNHPSMDVIIKKKLSWFIKFLFFTY